MRFSAIASAAAFLLLAAQNADAAAENGEFAVKDAGLLTCERFVEARGSQSPSYFQFVGWMSGYMSAYNLFSPDTVDIAPWQTTTLLDASIAGFCERNPAVTFVRAVNEVIQALAPGRLRGPSDIIEVSSGKTTMTIYRTILVRAQQSLREPGHFDGLLPRRRCRSPG